VEIGLVSTGELRQLKGTMEELCRKICPDSKFQVSPTALPGYHPGISATVGVAGQEAGAVGSISSEILEYYGLKTDIAAGTIRLDVLRANRVDIRKAAVLPRFPSVTRDISLVLDEQTRWADITESIENAGHGELVDVEYVTTYRGNPVPPGKKSVTLTLQYRSDKGTLTGEEVDRMLGNIISTLEKEFQAELR